MEFSITPSERQLFEHLKQTAKELGVPVYVVGGYVRDRLLGRPSKDIDIVCVGSGIALARKAAAHLPSKPKVAMYKRFGTAMFRYKEFELEFVGARRESYRSDSRKPIVEDGSLEDDQNRRDFTINALAVSLNEGSFGQILDPFEGLKDLEKGLLRTPLEPGITFSDDPLRMMRAIRFATQLDFQIEESALEAIAKQHERIKIVSQERITTELQKIMAADRPSLGFKLLFKTGLLHHIFPEMIALHGVEARQGRRHKDNFYHTLQVLDNICLHTDNIWLRWAALLHDIGKPPTKRFDRSVGWTFHGHEVVGARMVPKIFRKLRLPLGQEMRYVRKLVALHLRPISLTKDSITDSAVRRLLYDAGEELEDLLTLCEADITSKNAERIRRYRANYSILRERIEAVEEADKLRNWQPPISGDIIMATFELQPSKPVGLIKNAIREGILDGDIPNRFAEAFAYMLEQGKALGLEPQLDLNAAQALYEAEQAPAEEKNVSS